MELKTIRLKDQDVKYALATSRRARLLRITVHPDGSLVATRPWGMGEGSVQAFFVKRADWILGKLEYMKRFGSEILRARENVKRDGELYLQHGEGALRFVQERVEHWNTAYQYSFRRISVRNQKTRWGSCSKKGNLSFNFRIFFLPELLSDYLVVHELCHLGEFNHSKKFWDLVSRTIPDYRACSRELRKRGIWSVD